MSEKIEQYDILIIGGGPSGTVAASIARQNGYNIKIIEKSKFPRFVIGESLLPKCMENLEAAGFLKILKKQHFQKKDGALFLRGDESCFFDFGDQYTDGWTWTWQVPRSDFDHVLIQEVEKRGVSVEFEAMVTGVEFDGSKSKTTVVDKLGNHKYIKANYIIDASGYGRVLPRLLNLEKQSDLPAQKAIFTHVEDTNRPAGRNGHQITFVIHQVDIWMWIIPFSNGKTSIGFVGNPSFFDRFSGDPNDQILKMISEVDQIGDRFVGQKIILDTKILDTYSVSSEKLFGDGYVITGNSAEFIDPIFSSGVTFATQSGLLAGKFVSKVLADEKVDWQKEYTDFLKQGSDTFKSYVTSWYDGSLQDIFFYTSNSSLNVTNNNIKRQICSVLAGYVWDNTNPFVKKHERALKSLSDVINLQR